MVRLVKKFLLQGILGCAFFRTHECFAKANGTLFEKNSQKICLEPVKKQSLSKIQKLFEKNSAFFDQKIKFGILYRHSKQLICLKADFVKNCQAIFYDLNPMLWSILKNCIINSFAEKNFCYSRRRQEQTAYAQCGNDECWLQHSALLKKNKLQLKRPQIFKFKITPDSFALSKMSKRIKTTKTIDLQGYIDQFQKYEQMALTIDEFMHNVSPIRNLLSDFCYFFELAIKPFRSVKLTPFLTWHPVPPLSQAASKIFETSREPCNTYMVHPLRNTYFFVKKNYEMAIQKNCQNVLPVQNALLKNNQRSHHAFLKSLPEAAILMPVMNPARAVYCKNFFSSWRYVFYASPIEALIKLGCALNYSYPQKLESFNNQSLTEYYRPIKQSAYPVIFENEDLLKSLGEKFSDCRADVGCESWTLANEDLFKSLGEKFSDCRADVVCESWTLANEDLLKSAEEKFSDCIEDVGCESYTFDDFKTPISNARILKKSISDQSLWHVGATFLSGLKWLNV